MELFKRIDTVFLRVKDFDQSIEWYTNILGFELRWRDDVHGYGALNLGETALTLVRWDQDGEFIPSGKSSFNFYASDIDGTYKYLLMKDVEVGPINEDGNVRWFWFNDIDGNQLEVCWFQE